jgi:hypothetical protein
MVVQMGGSKRSLVTRSWLWLWERCKTRSRGSCVFREAFPTFAPSNTLSKHTGTASTTIMPNAACISVAKYPAPPYQHTVTSILHAPSPAPCSILSPHPCPENLPLSLLCSHTTPADRLLVGRTVVLHPKDVARERYQLRTCDPTCCESTTSVIHILGSITARNNPTSRVYAERYWVHVADVSNEQWYLQSLLAVRSQRYG